MGASQACAAAAQLRATSPSESKRCDSAGQPICLAPSSSAPHLLVRAPPRQVRTVQQQPVGRARRGHRHQHDQRGEQRAGGLEAVGVAQHADPHDAVDHVDHALGVAGLGRRAVAARGRAGAAMRRVCTGRAALRGGARTGNGASSNTAQLHACRRRAVCGPSYLAALRARPAHGAPLASHGTGRGAPVSRHAPPQGHLAPVQQACGLVIRFQHAGTCACGTAAALRY